MLLSPLPCTSNHFKILKIDSKRALTSGEKHQLLHRNMQRFRGALVFKAHRLSYHSILGWGVITKKKNEVREALLINPTLAPHPVPQTSSKYSNQFQEGARIRWKSSTTSQKCAAVARRTRIQDS